MCGKRRAVRFDAKKSGCSYFFCGGEDESSSSSSLLKPVEIPIKRSLMVSPIPARTSEQVSRRRFSADFARVSRMACEFWPKVVADANNQGVEGFSSLVL